MTKHRFMSTYHTLSVVFVQYQSRTFPNYCWQEETFFGSVILYPAMTPVFPIEKQAPFHFCRILSRLQGRRILMDWDTEMEERRE